MMGAPGMAAANPGMPGNGQQPNPQMIAALLQQGAGR